MASYFIDDSDYLEHYGVLGMKWGVRKDKGRSIKSNPKRQVRMKLDAAKAQKREAKKAYNKSFNKAYNRATQAYSPSKKRREANDKRWEDAYDKAEASRNASAAYKAAKAERKAQYRSNLKQVRSSSSIAERLFYNDATRRKAAKYMTDYAGVTMEDAKSQAKRDAKRNTAILLGLAGAYGIASSAYIKSRY